MSEISIDESPAPYAHAFFVGHQQQEAYLLRAYQRKSLAPAWILGGEKGIGKATLAWRFIRFILSYPDPTTAAVQEAQNLALASETPALHQVLQGTHSDVHVLQPRWKEKTKKIATDISMADVRELTRKFQYHLPGQSYRIALIDSAEDLNSHSAQALLKLVEEPPDRSIFLFISHQPGRLLPTLRSRCAKLFFSPLTSSESAEIIQKIKYPSAQLRESPSLFPPESLSKKTLSPSAQLSISSPSTQLTYTFSPSVSETLLFFTPNAQTICLLYKKVIQKLPEICWTEVHHLVDLIAPKEAELIYKMVLNKLFDLLRQTLNQCVKQNWSQNRKILSDLEKIWTKMTQRAQEIDIYHLDKKSFLLHIFSVLGPIFESIRIQESPLQNYNEG